ncbi:hypothetical protein [Streptomyces botrytidirepellens]|uniref:Uncharacterized protein n=1 Tax=Streptomyces botrytidirepellens TaxID=2486417 RepID=A0A3M8XAC9_9ACTN|nr:hypothetical protein [Streptomyces botrytidirepellens]RNG38110.1 hypothetical protein EEJ42_01705 [Streptomyces botrytidirepellens]
MHDEMWQAIRQIETAVRAGDYATALADAHRLYRDARTEAERSELLAVLGPRAIPPTDDTREGA